MQAMLHDTSMDNSSGSIVSKGGKMTQNDIIQKLNNMQDRIKSLQAKQ